MAIFGDINEANVLGRITQDIEVRHTPNGSQVTNFGVATNRSYRVEDEWKEDTTFHNVVVWGNDADYLSQHASKGARVYVSGRLQTRTWEDNDGKKNYKTEVVANRVVLLDKQRSAENSAPPRKDSKQPTKSAPPKKTEDAIDPDDLPF